MRLLLLLAALLLTSDSFAGAQLRARHIEQVPIRGSAHIPVHVYGPERAKSVVVVYPGGGGELVRQLEANGFPAHLVPPLTRAGYAVMLVDRPSDTVALWGKRLSPGHRDELRAVLRYARGAGHERVWVLGH